MTWKQLGKTLDVNQERIVGNAAQTFHADIISAWPVDTGYSKLQWQINRNGDTWVVNNHVKYSGILFVGRVGNRGSNQLPSGGYPIYKANILKMNRDLKANLL